MNQSSINTNQIQFIISDKVRLTEFNPSKSYAKSVYIIYDNIVYLSKVDITPGEFNPEQWEKISSTDELAKKQDKIQATGVDNLLTAPEEEGGQPGIIPINSFEPAFEILSKEKGGAGSDLTNVLTKDNSGDILVIDEQGNISNVEKLERVSLSQEINDSLDLANTSVQPDALDDAIDNVNTTITTHIDDKNNPHAVTKAQVGLGNVDNTTDIDKPISNATQEALDSLEANFDANIDSINAEISSINEDINELDERKADKATTLAGYGITDAYTKDEVNTELDKKLDKSVAAETYATIVNLNSHTSNTSNPHKVTKAQVGLGNVDNTSDANKPVSTAVQAALDLKADAESVYTKTETYDQATIDSKLAEKLDIDTASSTYATIDSLEAHTSDTSNPHAVTKAQVGLGNVDNTSDLAKPISNATQSALDLKANISDVEADLETKQDTLVSGTNIKTINNNTILGSGNIQLQTELSGTEGNVVIYTSTTGQLNELGFDETPTLDSNSLLTSSVVYSALLDKINYTDIVNDVTTGGVNKVLSAEQGKYLDNRITQAMQSTHNRGVVLNALTSQGQNYSVTNATINNGGTGYRDGDALLLVSEELKIDSIIVVETIDSNGAITAITLSKGGSFVSDPAGTGVSYVGGSGSGATFDITSSLVDNITLEDITNPQPNDFATVIQDELHNNVIYVWQYADFNGDGTYNWVSGYPVQADQRDFIIEPITVNELATNAVSTVKIVDGSVTLNKLASNSVNGTKIVANTINDSHIAADANIAQSKIANLMTDLNSKANQATTYTKTEVDNKVNTKQNTITGAATSIVSDNLTADRVLVSNTDGKVAVSSISTTKVGYLSDVTSNIQAQINSKANQSTTYNKTEVDDLLDAKLDSDTAASTYATQATVTSHINNKNNPHAVTKAQVGLGNVDNTSDADKPISTAQAAALDAVESNLQSQITSNDTDISNLQNNKADKTTDFQTPITETNKGATMKEIEEVQTTSIKFKGYVSTTQPASDAYLLVDGNIWINAGTMPSSFPVPASSIRVWDGSAWQTTTESYTPTALDAWSNLNNNEGYYWFGAWKMFSTDLSTEYFTLNQTSGLWEIKQSIHLPGTPTVDTPDGTNPQALVNVDYVNTIETIGNKITNCVLQIPQNINLELNNGTLTLKAGSKTYMPRSGGGFDELVTTRDLTYSHPNNGEYLIFIDSRDRWISLMQTVYCFSGTTEPEKTGYKVWYDTGTNIINFYNADNVASKQSFPIAKITVSGGQISSIDAVFNGFGFIGSLVFSFPGLKVAVPNGRNPDGTLNNLTTEQTRVVTAILPNSTRTKLWANAKGLIAVNDETTSDYGYTYDERLNIVYSKNNMQRQNYAHIADLTLNPDDNLQIIDINPKYPIRVTDYWDFNKRINDITEEVSNANKRINDITEEVSNTAKLDAPNKFTSTNNSFANQILIRQNNGFAPVNIGYNSSGTQFSIHSVLSSGWGAAVGVDADGTYCSTPAPDSDGGNIANTEWVRNLIAGILHTMDYPIYWDDADATDHSHAMPGVDTPTNHGWYRVYKSGRLEQGGMTDDIRFDSDVSFFIPFVQTPSVMVSSADVETTTPPRRIIALPVYITPMGFTAQSYIINDTGAIAWINAVKCWEAKGRRS